MSDMDDPITVKDLRGLFAEFELKLFTRLQEYATLAALAAVEHRLDDLRAQNEQRIGKLELWRAGQEGGTNTGRRISASALAWAALAVAVIGAVATLIVLWPHPHP